MLIVIRHYNTRYHLHSKWLMSVVSAVGGTLIHHELATRSGWDLDTMEMFLTLKNRAHQSPAGKYSIRRIEHV